MSDIRLNRQGLTTARHVMSGNRLQPEGLRVTLGVLSAPTLVPHGPVRRCQPMDKLAFLGRDELLLLPGPARDVPGIFGMSPRASIDGEGGQHPLRVFDQGPQPWVDAAGELAQRPEGELGSHLAFQHRNE